MNTNIYQNTEIIKRRIKDRLDWLQLQELKPRSEPYLPWSVWIKQRLKASLLQMPVLRGWLICLYLTFHTITKRKQRMGVR